MKQKITASVVAKLLCPVEKEQAWVRDTEVSGFSVRITNKGIKSFVFEKRPKGVARVKRCKKGQRKGWPFGFADVITKTSQHLSLLIRHQRKYHLNYVQQSA